MSKRLGWLLGIAVVLTAGHGLVLAVYPGASPGAEMTSAAQSPSPDAALDTRSTAPRAFDEIVVTLEIPAAEDVSADASRGSGCPQDTLGELLGITLAQPHGLVVATVSPDGPAARAGILPGDRLGDTADCPSSTLPLYRPQSEPRQVEVKVRRPAPPPEATTEAGEPAAPQPAPG